MFELLLDLFPVNERRVINVAMKLAPLVAAALLVGLAGNVSAQKWSGHSMYGPNEPPGAIGRQQLLGTKHRRGYTQPVRITAPNSTWVAPASSGSFGEAQVGFLQVGLQIGEVYRFEVASAHGDYIVYPSIELIDRLYPPEGMRDRFPIPIQLTDEELRLAAEGNYVTRVIYIEDPNTALPYRGGAGKDQEYFEVLPEDDPVEAAFGMGRPLAILRMGAKAPVRDAEDPDFNFGAKEVQVYPGPVRPTAPLTQASNRVTPVSYGAEAAREPKRLRPPKHVLPLR